MSRHAALPEGETAHIPTGMPQTVHFDGTDDGVEAFIRCVLSSPCCMAVVPMQDVLHLGSEARMNLPGTIGGNWAWRMKPGAATEDVARHLREMNQEYQRV